MKFYSFQGECDHDHHQDGGHNILM